MNNLINLSNKGISKETIEKLNIVENEEKDYIINVSDELNAQHGQVILKRSTRETIEPDFEYAIPFEQHFNQKSKEIIITDRLLDFLTIAQCFKFTKTVFFCPSEEAIKNYCALLPNLKRVSIINNNKTFMNDAYKYFQPEVICNVKLPHKKTINDIYLNKDYALINNLIEGKDLKDGLNLVDTKSFLKHGLKIEKSVNKFPFPCLNNLLGGVKKQEVIFVVAGSAGGKTDFGFRVMDQFMREGDRVGVFAMEQRFPQEVLFQMASYRGDFKYSIDEIMENQDDLTHPNIVKYHEQIEQFVDQISIFDTTQVSLTVDNIENYIRNYVRVEGVNHIMIDHITFFAHKGGAKGIDEVGQFVTKLVELGQELGCTFLITSQVHKMGGKGQDAEHGVQISPGDIFGSSAIFHAGTLILALERNSQSEDEEEQNTTTCRVLKSRYNAEAMGKKKELWYDTETGQKIDKELRAEYEINKEQRKMDICF